MKESSGKSGKRLLPLAIGLALFLGCLLLLAPFKRGSFFNDYKNTGGEGARFTAFTPGKETSVRYKILDRGYREMAVSL